MSTSRAVATGLTLIYCAIVHDVWNPRMISIGLDESWLAVMHLAWLEGWQFGDQLVWTGGPYNFVYSRMFHPETYPLVVAIALAVSSCVVLAIWRIALEGTGQLLLAASLAVVVFEIAHASPDLEAYLLVCLTLLLATLRSRSTSGVSERETDLILDGCALSLALLSLGKHSFLLAAAPAIALASIDSSLRQRRFPRLLVSYVAGLVVFWLLAGQPILGIPAFLDGVWEITAGYSDAMSRRRGAYARVVTDLVVALLALGWLGLGLWPLI